MSIRSLGSHTVESIDFSPEHAKPYAIRTHDLS